MNAKNNRNMVNGKLDSRYAEQMAILRDIAREEGLVIRFPDEHAVGSDANTVMFYTLKEHAYNEMVDQSGSGDYIVRKTPFFVFENTDINGEFSYDYANQGRIDLRSLTTRRDCLRGHVRLYRALRKQHQYIIDHGSIWKIPEADQGYNDLNREIIEAARKAYGKIYLGNINYYDRQRERIVADAEDVFKEYTGEVVYNFGYCFCVPKKDMILRDLIRSWNGAEKTNVVAKAPEQIIDRIDEIGGFSFIWF